MFIEGRTLICTFAGVVINVMLNGDVDILLDTEVAGTSDLGGYVPKNRGWPKYLFSIVV